MIGTSLDGVPDNHGYRQLMRATERGRWVSPWWTSRSSTGGFAKISTSHSIGSGPTSPATAMSSSPIWRRRSRRIGEGVHAVAVQSGSAAEFFTLKSLGIGPSDEVITVPNSDNATTSAISHSGATFVLVDIDPQTHTIDPFRIEAATTPRTRAIVPVHTYGRPAELDAILEVSRRHKRFSSKTPGWRSAPSTR